MDDHQKKSVALALRFSAPPRPLRFKFSALVSELFHVGIERSHGFALSIGERGGELGAAGVELDFEGYAVVAWADFFHHRLAGEFDGGFVPTSDP